MRPGSAIVLAGSASGLFWSVAALGGPAQTRVYGDGFETTACTALIGQACDGADQDQCAEGTIGCNAGQPQCSDLSADNPDLCNGNDDDCNAATVDGSSDPLIGQICDGGDGDLCNEGLQQCLVGMAMCSDTSPDSLEQCNGLDDDCDAQVDEDFPRNTDPPCSAAVILAPIAGDSGNAVLERTGQTEAWFRLHLNEASDGIEYLSATITLTPGFGTDFDLFAYCLSCGGVLIDSSTNAGNNSDTVFVRRDDTFGSDDGFDVLLEIRHAASDRCAPWSLQINGNSVVTPGFSCP